MRGPSKKLKEDRYANAGEHSPLVNAKPWARLHVLAVAVDIGIRIFGETVRWIVYSVGLVTGCRCTSHAFQICVQTMRTSELCGYNRKGIGVCLTFASAPWYGVSQCWYAVCRPKRKSEFANLVLASTLKALSNRFNQLRSFHQETVAVLLAIACSQLVHRS